MVKMTTHYPETIKVLGKRVLVEKERIDMGVFKTTPALEEDGQKNTGKIIAVGQIGLLNRLRGVKVGAIVNFKKFFVCNADLETSKVYVDVENITGIVI